MITTNSCAYRFECFWIVDLVYFEIKTKLVAYNLIENEKNKFNHKGLNM
jgi:hypothetical protein